MTVRLSQPELVVRFVADLQVALGHLFLGLAPIQGAANAGKGGGAVCVHLGTRTAKPPAQIEYVGETKNKKGAQPGAANEMAHSSSLRHGLA